MVKNAAVRSIFAAKNSPKCVCCQGFGNPLGEFNTMLLQTPGGLEKGTPHHILHHPQWICLDFHTLPWY